MITLRDLLTDLAEAAIIADVNQDEPLNKQAWQWMVQILDAAKPVYITPKTYCHGEWNY